MLTAKRLREALEYHPDDGSFWRKKKTARNIVVGRKAGSLKPTGYIAINLFGVRYFAHRLAWLYVHGRWPKAEIDHINANRSDNRITNLREATHSQNGYHKPAKLPVRGVRFDKQREKWHAQIKINGKALNLGRYQTQAEAAVIRAQVAHQAFGEFAMSTNKPASDKALKL